MVNNFLKILLLEDEIKDAEIIQHKLKTHGNQYVFKLVMSEPEYINALHEFKPHVILSDTSMPQFSATEALRILQSTPYHIPFILVTGNASEEFAADIIKMGADDYLLKDRLTRLPAAIEAALKQKQTEKEKKAAAEKLKKSEENYRSMLERVAEAFIAIDKRWHCTYINKKAGEIFNADPSIIVGKNIWTGLPGAAGMLFNTVFHQVMKNQQHAVFETFYPPSSIWLECHIYPSADGLSVFCNDITGRKKAEERIKASEEKYRLLNDQAFDAIVIYAPDGSILESNHSAAVNTGYSREELATLNITALFQPEDLQKRPISFDLLKAGHSTLDYRKLIKKDGSFAEMEIGTKMMPDGNLIATGRDITERKKNEELLREERDKFTKIAATAPGLIYSFRRTENGSFQFPYASNVIENILGFTHEELQNDAKKVFALVHKDDVETVIAQIESSAKTMLLCRKEFRYQHPVKGEIWLEGHSIPTQDISGSIIWYGVLTDATHRKEIEKRIIKTKRLYSFISHINQIIVRSTQEESLFRDVCDIAVNYGKFKMAWVGLADEQTKTVIPVAHSSNEKNIFQLFKNISFDDSPDGQGPTGIAVRKGRYVVCNDIKTDTGFAFSMENIIKQGLRSLIALPIKKFGKVMGVFAVYADEKNFFDANEIYLLEVAANDVSFALENFEKERLRIEAVEHLAANEKRFRKLVEHGNDAILILNAEGQPFYISSSVQKVLGYTEEELRQLDILALSHPESSEAVKNVIKTAVENPGETFTAPPVQILHKDGKYHWYESTITNLMDDPDIGGIVDNFRDVTEKASWEKTLKESEENYRTLVEQASDAIFISDENGKFLTVNSSGFKLSQYSEDELMQMTIYDFFVEEDIKKKPIQFEALRQGKIVRSERLMRRKDGAINHVEITAKIMTNGKLLSFVRDIAERKKAEETIKIANERFNFLAAATADMIWDWNLETDEIWWSNAYYNVFGSSDLPYDVIGWKNIVHPDDRERVLSGINKAIRSGEKRWEDEYRCIAPDGNVLFIYDRGFVLDNNEGKPYRMIGSMVDLSEQKKAEAEIKVSEEKYRTLVEQASDAILISDNCGKLITVNTSACRLFGYSEEELLTRKISDFTAEEDKKRSVLRFDELHEGKTLITERLIKIKNDVKVNVEITTKLLSNGRLLFFIKDISERIKAQNDIINEKELSDSLINNLPGIFYLYDEEGHFLRWNKNFETVTEYNAEEIKNMHPRDFYDPSIHEFVTKRIESVFREKTPGAEALLLTKSKKKIPFYFNSMSINYKSKPCLIGMGMDISTQKKAEEEIRRLASHLQDIREEERKRIGREIHDELGQQLTAIKMDVSWLNKKLPEEPSLIKTKLKNVIALLDSSNLSIRRILNELRPSILEKHGFIESMEWLGLQFTKNTGIPVIFKSPETEPTLPEPVITGIFRIYQEALNNIIKYAHASEVVTTLNVDDDLLVFTVKDNGHGFEPDSILSKKSFGILGMKERIILLGGDFELTTSPGSGTKITIFLPLNN